MGYRELYQESNEQAAERFELVMERIAQIAEQTDVPEVYDDYFKKTAAFLLQLKEIVTEKENASTETKTMEALEQENKALYEDLFAENLCDRLWKSGICSRKTRGGIRSDPFLLIRRVQKAHQRCILCKENECDNRGRTFCGSL